jgi:protein ImuB
MIKDGSRARVLLCNHSAADLGVYPGQAVNAALALVPGLELCDRDVAAEVRTMRGLATRAHRFTPAVHIDAANALLLDVQGSLRFFGGLGALRSALVGDLEQQGHDFLIACAPTARASLWLAKSGREQTIRGCAELPGRLGDLPLGCLGWPADVERILSGAGVTTVGDCMRLPRDGLARRIGPARLAELDQACGARAEPFEFHRPPRHFVSTLELPAETSGNTLLLTAFEQLLVRLDAYLRRHQGAVQVLWIRLYHEDRPATLERIGLLRAATNGAYLLELARIRFDELQLAAPVVSLQLGAALVAAPPVVERDLLGDRADERHGALALIEQLRVRLGADAVHGIVPVFDHRPEAAWKPVSLSSQCIGRQTHNEPADGDLCYARVSRRPVWMLAEPRALNAAGDRPVFGDVLQLDDGPERIETGWWDGRDVRRDYYVARNRSGMRLWVYRDYRESRWYLHGLFG